MGIKHLFQVIEQHAPNAISHNTVASHFGRTFAIDASMMLYKYLVMIRQGFQAQSLTNANGEVTSHLLGFFYTTIRLLEQGIKPVYVFDGVAPDLKQGELNNRRQKRADATEKIKELQAQSKIEGNCNNQDEIDKLTKRTVCMTKEHVTDIKKLLKLMGVPTIDAPGEAEAQCAFMVKNGMAYGVATDDMDTLTFGGKKMVRNLTKSTSVKTSTKTTNRKGTNKNGGGVVEIDLEKVLQGFQMTMPQFIDFCILCGCDYTGTIKGIGHKRAFDLIIKHVSIEEVLKHLDTDKYIVPASFLYKEARELFVKPLVDEKQKIVSSAIDKINLVEFLVTEKQFQKERVVSSIERLEKTRKKVNQGRIDSMFTFQLQAPKEIAGSNPAPKAKAKTKSVPKKPSETLLKNQKRKRENDAED